jgi:hypothetical protein
LSWEQVKCLLDSNKGDLALRDEGWFLQGPKKALVAKLPREVKHARDGQYHNQLVREMFVGALVSHNAVDRKVLNVQQT